MSAGPTPHLLRRRHAAINKTLTNESPIAQHGGRRGDSGVTLVSAAHASRQTPRATASSAKTLSGRGRRLRGSDVCQLGGRGTKDGFPGRRATTDGPSSFRPASFYQITSSTRHGVGRPVTCALARATRLRLVGWPTRSPCGHRQARHRSTHLSRSARRGQNMRQPPFPHLFRFAVSGTIASHLRNHFVQIACQTPAGIERHRPPHRNLDVVVTKAPEPSAGSVSQRTCCTIPLRWASVRAAKLNASHPYQSGANSRHSRPSPRNLCYLGRGGPCLLNKHW